jgi:hypothetical protein
VSGFGEDAGGASAEILVELQPHATSTKRPAASRPP